MTIFRCDDVAFVSGLQARTDLNGHAARVCQVRLPRRTDDRIGVEMFIGQERVWIKPSNLTPIPNMAHLSHPRYDSMSVMEKTNIGMFFFANEKSTPIFGLPSRVISTHAESVPLQTALALALAPVQRRNVDAHPALATTTRATKSSRSATTFTFAPPPPPRDADDEAVDAFLEATLARWDRERFLEATLPRWDRERC